MLSIFNITYFRDSPCVLPMLDQPNIRNVRLEPRITNHGARTTNHELLCAFDFAIGENEQAAVDGTVVKWNPGDVVEIDHLGKLRASSYQPTHIAFALLAHEVADSFIHTSEFHWIAKAYAVFGIEENTALVGILLLLLGREIRNKMIWYWSISEVARLELY